MSDFWRERFDAHPAHQHLDELEALLHSTEPPETPESAGLMLGHAMTVAAHIRSMLVVADPELAPRRPMDVIDDRLVEAIAATTAFRETADQASLDRLQVALDGAVENARLLPEMLDPDLERMRAAATSYRQSVS